MRVLVVDDHALFREGLISLLEREDEFQVVDQAGSIHEALEKAVAWQPDMLVLDVLLPDGNGIDIIPTLLQISPGTKIVILTILEDEQLHIKALRSGAKGYLTKSIAYSHLVDSLKALESGEATLTDNIAGRSPVEFSQKMRPGNGKYKSDLRFLTNREREVLDQLATGATNQEIADRLGVSPNTVRVYISRIIHKLHLGDGWEVQQFAASGSSLQTKK